MNNLANCKPTEFLKQTNKIRKAVDRWLTATDIINIRKRLPQLTTVTEDMTPERKAEVIVENKKRSEEQLRKNMMDMFESILEAHPDETLELLGLLCFVEPEDIDKHTVTEYIENFTELISNEAVISFFISLARWGNNSLVSSSNR